MSVNLKTMGARPCGACRALVDERTGCVHWAGSFRKPFVQATEHRLRKMLGGSQHVFLTEAAANSAGIGRAMGRGKVSVAIKKLRDTGLVEKSEEYGFGAYAITAAGRDVLSKLESMQREIARRAR